MAMANVDPEQAAAMAAREAPPYSVLLRIATEAPLRLWTGIGDFPASADDDLEPSAIYDGAGVLTAMPALRQLIGGVAERLTFTFSGTDAVPSSYVNSPTSDIERAEIDIGLVFFDQDWQAVAPVGWLWSGRVSTASASRNAGVKSVSLSCVSGCADRTRAGLRYWTDASHQRRHPGDLVCDKVSRYSVGTSITWGG